MRIIHWTDRWFPVVFTLVLLLGTLIGRVEGLIFDVSPFWFSFLVGLESFSLLFVSIFLEALPFLLLGTLASGIIGSVTNPGWFIRFLPESALGQVCWGTMSGLWLPVGETGTIPLARQFRQMGLPDRFTTAFLVAAPIVNPITIASLWVVFGPGFVMIGCVIMALVAALTTGMVVDTLTGSDHPHRAVQRDLTMPGEEQVSRFQRAALIAVDLLFETGRWLVVGALLSASILVVLKPGRLISDSFGGIAWIVVSGFLGILGSNEASSAPFALMPMINLIPRGAMISAIVLGSQASLKRMIMLRSVLEYRNWFMIVFIPVLTCMVMAAGVVTFLHW